jgi:histidyl-tRNA synthetase
MIKAVRGTRDLLPPETALWNLVEATARDLFRAYNFHEIRTPIFEETQLFARSVGEETDIVSKEMYTWEEGTNPAATLVGAWYNQAKPKYAGPFWRTTSGRQHINIDVWGGAETYLVELKLSPDLGVVDRLEARKRAWLASHPDSKPPRLVLAVPTGEADRAQRIPLGEVVLEPLSVAAYEAPQSLTLRPENTAGVVRAYIEHKLWDRGLNKLFYIGPMFRRERPQKGRYRQFYQIGAEVIGPPTAGSESPARDAEVIEFLATLLDRLDITGWTLELNSVGCANDRAVYNQALGKALEPVVGQMCSDCRRRAVTNPLRVFDCKVPEDQPIIETLPRISQFLDEPCRKHFAQVQSILKFVGVDFCINDRLVRGLDYYTRTAFEFTHGALGAQNAILGGGRYDGLSESLGGPSAPGVGFSIGEDRLALALKQSAAAVQRKPDVYIAPLGAGMDREAGRLARELRRSDIVVELGDETFRMKKSLETASKKLGARFALILGENEIKSGRFALKNLESGEQISVPRAELAGKIRQHRSDSQPPELT